MTIRSTLALLTFAWLSMGTAHADESDANHPAATDDAASVACVRAYEQAQEQRHSGKLLEARAQLQSCSRDACPKFIRSDCANWYTEVQAEVPTVVFAARSRGRDLTDVRVSLGLRVLASRMDGGAIELDPGEYDFDFTAPGMRPLTEHVLISRGERNRLQRAELIPLREDERVGHAGAPLPPPAGRSWLVPGVLGGVAVVGLSSFVAFGAWGRSDESKLETTCSPHCSDDQVSGVRTKYAVADVSLAVAAASLGLAAYFALSAPPPQSVARPSAFDVKASAHGLSATYRGAF